jgi:DNA anti-recombination protein RmuC
MMNINKAPHGVGIESGDVKASAEELAASFRRVSEASTREIEKLVAQLQTLRTQLESAGNRIERDIAQYTELSQQTTQLTAIISDSVNKLPDGTRHQPLRH